MSSEEFSGTETDPAKKEIRILEFRPWLKPLQQLYLTLSFSAMMILAAVTSALIDGKALPRNIGGHAATFAILFVEGSVLMWGIPALGKRIWKEWKFDWSYRAAATITGFTLVFLSLSYGVIMATNGFLGRLIAPHSVAEILMSLAVLGVEILLLAGGGLRTFGWIWKALSGQTLDWKGIHARLQASSWVPMDETRVAAIRKLVMTGHLNVEERGVFEARPLEEGELHTMISIMLSQEGCIPPGSRPWKEGEAVQEGYFIERLDNGKYRLHWQRHHATNPFQLAENFHRDHSKPWNAVRAFIRKEYGKTIDGIPIRYPNRFWQYLGNYLPWFLLAALVLMWMR